MKNEPTGKIALVTGSSRGFGRATAVALAKAGADVAVNDVRREIEGQAVGVEVEAVGIKPFSPWFLSRHVRVLDDMVSLVSMRILS